MEERDGEARIEFNMNKTKYLVTGKEAKRESAIREVVIWMLWESCRNKFNIMQ